MKDSSGAIIPNATVTAKNLGTAAVRTITTGPSGEYVMADMDVGHYSLSVSQTGFRTTVIPDIELLTGQSATIDVVLQLGAITQQVTVSTVAPMISTTSSDVGQVVPRTGAKTSSRFVASSGDAWPTALGACVSCAPQGLPRPPSNL